MRRSELAYLGLGSNLVNPARQILGALDAIAATPGLELIARSSFYRTAPQGYLDQPDFLNAVAAVRTTLAPRELLAALLNIERCHGRRREFVNAPRTLDLDILLYGELQQDDEALVLPHPRAHLRAFVLQPLLEIAPDCVIPGRGRAAAWLALCADQPVVRIAEERLVRMALGSIPPDHLQMRISPFPLFARSPT